MDKLWHLLGLIINGTVKKASGTISLDGKEFEATVYIVPTQTLPVYRIDLTEVKK